MRRIRAHLRILENGAPLAPNQRSRGIEQSRRRHSVSYGGGQSHADLPPNRATLKYHPDHQVGARPEQFLRIDRQATYSRAASEVSSRGTSRSTSVRHENRGRGGRRHDDYDSSDGSDYYVERRPRGRSLHR
jgi:ribosome assembly protein 4